MIQGRITVLTLVSRHMLKLSRTFVVASLISLCSLTPLVHAADDVIVTGEGVAVNINDLNAEALKLTPEKRKAALGKPESVSQLASNLYVRRAMAAEVVKLKLADDPVVAAALQIARDRVLAEIMLARIDAAHTPSDETLDKLALSQYRAEPKKYETPEAINTRHILVRSSDPGAKGKAEFLMQQLKSGYDFEKLAASESQDPRSAAKGGEVGFTPRGKMVPPYEAAAWALKSPGDLSGIVQTEYGFHIIKLIAKRDAGLRPFEEVREQARAEVLANVLNEARKAEAQRLLGAAKFESSAIEAFAASLR